MRILITGATGLIGRSLTHRLLSLSHEITILTRDIERAKQHFSEHVTYWSTLDDKSSLDGFEAVINLAGEPIIGKRWTADQKIKLCNSRWLLTEQLSYLIKASNIPPATFISGSAMGYYGDQGQSVVTEEEAPHNEFTHELCARWEALAMAAESPHTRVCLSRTGIVLSSEGGIMQKILPIFRLGLGGAMGDGKQYIPWIHLDDMVNALYYLLMSPELKGPFNIVSPYPATNEHFTATLADVLGRPAFMHVPTSALKLIHGEASVLLLGGQRGLPQNLESAGFGFRYFELKEAFAQIVEK